MVDLEVKGKVKCSEMYSEYFLLRGCGGGAPAKKKPNNGLYKRFLKIIFEFRTPLKTSRRGESPPRRAITVVDTSQSQRESHEIISAWEELRKD